MGLGSARPSEQAAPAAWGGRRGRVLERARFVGGQYLIFGPEQRSSRTSTSVNRGWSQPRYSAQAHGLGAPVFTNFTFRGTLGTAGQKLQIRLLVFGNNRHSGRSRHFAAAGELALDDAVLERLIRHYYEAPPNRERFYCRWHGVFQRLKFPIHSDAQGLEGALGGIAACAPRRGRDSVANKGN